MDKPISEDNFFRLATINYNKEVIKEMLECLTKRQQEVIKYRYGVCGYPFKRLGELANMFNCSKQAISIQEHRALKKMRKLYSNKYQDLI